MSFSRDTGKSIAHPEWVDSALEDIAKFRRIRALPHFPKSLDYPMFTTDVARLAKCAWPSLYHAAWWFLCRAIGSTKERIHGTIYRFWRYRIQMKSQDRDWREMMSYLCLKCTVMSPFTETGDDQFTCESCGWVTDFSGICEMTAGDDDDE